MSEETKEQILDRLYKSSSVCGICGSATCPHDGYRKLPEMLPMREVIRAIDYRGSVEHGEAA